MRNKINYTIPELNKMKSEGRIRGYNDHGTVKTEAKKVMKKSERSKEKEWLSWNLPYWCNENSVSLETEYGFHPARKWRFDWAIPSLKIAVEYEGIFSEKSRHTTVKGYNADADKYNTAAAMGWRVIRLTAKNYTGVLKILNEMI